MNENKQTEIWKRICELDGIEDINERYLISTHGRVKNEDTTNIEIVTW